MNRAIPTTPQSRQGLVDPRVAVDESGKPVLELIARHDPSTDGEYLREIINAVNCHEELLTALEAMQKAFAQVLPGIGYIACQDYAIVNEAPILAARAIAKAKGGSQ